MARASRNRHRFWRDPSLPHLEARSIEEGQEVSYGWHSHPTFSIGLVTGGVSDFRIGADCHRIDAGTVVLMNPDEAHVCNPMDGRPWSYRMLYADAAWLAALEGEAAFRPFAPHLSRDPDLAGRLEWLFGLLFALRRELGSDAAYQVISGYRCPATNDRLRRTRGGGVARHSLHMDGMAIDIRLPGVPLADLRDAAQSLSGGGVGFYKTENFVHVDTGRVRHWG